MTTPCSHFGVAIKAANFVAFRMRIQEVLDDTTIYIPICSKVSFRSLKQL